MPRNRTAASIRQSRRGTPHRERDAAGRQEGHKTLAALARESDRQLEELIARRLALPLEKRMNFLRRRLPGGGSCL